MLLTFPPVFTAKFLRNYVNNERDLEAHLRTLVYNKVSSNRNSRTTIILFRLPYTPQIISIIKQELNERGFAVANYIDLSTENPKKGIKITY